MPKGNDTFWNGKRIHVTGGAGFLGSHLVQRFERRNAKVFVSRIEEYDPTREDDVDRCYDKADQEL
jgi:nucleoside-diphosphate-sugar epimerase